jgi:predicted metal-binding membrane protein
MIRRPDRSVILLALLVLTALSWLWLISLGRGMSEKDMASMSGMAMPIPMSVSAPWVATRFALTFAMWWVMMVGMMLPSAAPMILMFATVNRKERVSGKDFVPVSIFTLGYLLVWGAFSAGATMAQWVLDQLAMLSASMTTISPMVGGTLLIAAGIYQFTPLKQACLRQCRSPLAFVLNHWHQGRIGALRMGIEHGAFCLGCCWVLMALLFVVGVMNLLSVAAIAAFVFVEKLLPGGPWIGRIGGGAMVAVGAWLAAAGA